MSKSDTPISFLSSLGSHSSMTYRWQMWHRSSALKLFFFFFNDSIHFEWNFNGSRNMNVLFLRLLARMEEWKDLWQSLTQRCTDAAATLVLCYYSLLCSQLEPLLLGAGRTSKVAYLCLLSVCISFYWTFFHSLWPSLAHSLYPINFPLSSSLYFCPPHFHQIVFSSFILSILLSFFNISWNMDGVDCFWQKIGQGRLSLDVTHTHTLYTLLLDFIPEEKMINI